MLGNDYHVVLLWYTKLDRFTFPPLCCVDEERVYNHKRPIFFASNSRGMAFFCF
jgi:hypothetical protein